MYHLRRADFGETNPIAAYGPAFEKTWFSISGAVGFLHKNLPILVLDFKYSIKIHLYKYRCKQKRAVVAVVVAVAVAAVAAVVVAVVAAVAVRTVAAPTPRGGARRDSSTCLDETPWEESLAKKT